MKALVVALMLALVPSLATAAPPDECFGQPTNDPRSSDEADYLSGTEGVDIIATGTGADQVFSFTADDVLCGNEGDDLLVGEGGDDQLAGSDGDDHLVGFGGGDSLVAGFGADTLEGDGGADTLRSSAGDGIQDDLYDGAGEDTIIGNPEDVWHRCDDDAADDHSGFEGQIVPDPTC